MSTADERSGKELPMVEHSWLYDHIGRIAGMALGLIFIIALAFLAIIGFAPALFFLVLVVAGVGIIALGAQMRGGR